MTTPEHAQSAEWAQTVRLSRLLDQIAENARAHEKSHGGFGEAITEQVAAMNDELELRDRNRTDLRLKLVNLAGLTLAWLARLDAVGLM